MNVEQLLLEADKMIEKKEYDNAMLYLKTVLEIDESNFVALTGIVELYSEFEMYGEAVKYAKKRYKKYPKNKDTIFSLGYIYQTLGKFKKAISVYKKFLEEEDNYFVYLNLGMCYSFLKYFKKAMEYVEKAIELEPKSVEAYVQKGDIFTMMKKYDSAILQYKNLVNFKGIKLAKLYARMGDTMVYSNDVKKAIKYYNIAISCEDVQDYIFEDFFEILLQAKEYKEIELLFLNYENSGLSRIKMLNLKGRYYLARKKFSEAEKICRKMIMIEPEVPRHYYNLIFVLEKEHKYDEAFECIKNNKNILTNENILKELKKKLNEGKRKYKKILKNKKQEVTDE